MSKSDGDWSSRFRPAVVFLLTVMMPVPRTRAQVGPSSSPQIQKRMVQAVDKTLQEGLHAKLPPHISTLLGLSKEGVLRRVVTVKEGVGRIQKITSEDRKAFEKEKQFWLDRLAPDSAP